MSHFKAESQFIQLFCILTVLYFDKIFCNKALFVNLKAGNSLIMFRFVVVIFAGLMEIIWNTEDAWFDFIVNLFEMVTHCSWIDFYFDAHD